MAKILDPDKLSKSNDPSTGTPTGNVYFDLTNLTIELLPNTAGGWVDAGNELLDDNYNAGGVTLQALYSFLKEQWKTDVELIKYPFPMVAITAEQFEFVEDWTLTDGQETPTALFNSKKLIRDAGWAERGSGATGITKEYAGIISLGTLVDANAAPYYAFAGDSAKRTLNYGGQVNEAVLIFDSVALIDDREKLLTLYVRSAPTGSSGNVEGYSFAQTNTADIGVSVLATQAYRFPLAQAVDPNVDLLASELTGGVFDDMRIEYYLAPESVSDTGTTFSVGVIINADFGTNSALVPTLSQIYQWVQNELRKSTDINVSPGDESTVGELTDQLVQFVGATLKTLRQSDGDGVIIKGVGSTELNNVEFVDNAGDPQVYPFKVGVNLDFNSNILDDPNSKYFLFYTTNTGGNFGTGNAVSVTKEDTTDVVGDVHTQPASYTGAMSGTSDGSITAAARTMQVTGAGWSSPELVGKILSVTTGTNTGKYYIASHTTDTITIESDGKVFDEDATVSWSLIEPNEAGGTNVPRITFTYNYASNADGGRTPDTPADITLVALGLEKAQYATAAGTITKVNSVTLPISNPLERNYEDPIGI